MFLEARACDEWGMAEHKCFQMTKWASGTSSRAKQGKWNHLEGENTRSTRSVVDNNFILETSGCDEGHGQKYICFSI